MSKLSYEDKIEIYKKRKNRLSIKAVSVEYNVNSSIVKYLVRLIDKHGYDILRTYKNKKYSKCFKQEAINRVLLNNEPIFSVTIDIGLPSYGTLQNWIKKI